MKQRILALLCTICLCLTLFLPTRAVGEVCFTSVNDTVLPLTADSMPLWSGGVLYVPHNVFDMSSTGISFGTNSSYNKSSGIVSIFNMHQMLTFDIENATCFDQHTGQTFSGRAIIRNGKAYVPAARVCTFFGLSAPSYRLTEYGYLVRIKNTDAALDDETFVDAASNILSNRLRDYNQSLKPQAPVVTPPAPTPSQPSVTPQDPEPIAIPTYLAFRCDTLQAGAGIADILEQNGSVGLFFFPAREVSNQGALIRRLLGCGHSVGILANGSSAEETLTLLQEGSLALNAVAHTRTYFAHVPKDHRQAVDENGWVCWSGTEAIPDGTLSPYSHALTAVRALPKRGNAYLLLDDSQFSASTIKSLLRQLDERSYTVSIPRESRL